MQSYSSKMPQARTEMLIRRPIAEVFEAFVDPTVTTRFWFTKSSGKLEAGKQVRWEWEMYGASTEVKVKALEKNERIVIEWEGPGGWTTVEFGFASRAEKGTLVSITNTGFGGDADEIVSQVVDATGGFSLVLAGAKAFLEHKIMLNLIADRYPDGH
jgi:uncharacterized protein YndB with AHSA1/START domain